METLLLVTGIAVVVMILSHPPQTQIVYVPVEPVERREGLGCLPVILVGLLVLVVLGVIRV